LTPHDTARTTFDRSVVEVIDGIVGVGRIVEIDVGVAEGSASDGVAAYTNGSNWADRVEDFVKIGFGNVANLE
jgi:hypothetical protein